MEIYGSFKVKIWCNKGVGYDLHYGLIFAKDRLIAAKLGKQWGMDDQGAMIGGLTFGIAGAILGSIADKRDRQKLEEKASKLVELTPEEILKMEKENFEIAYAEIEKVEMQKKAFLAPSGTLKIVGNVTPILVKLGYKPTAGLFRKEVVREVVFDIGRDQDFGECKNIVSAALQSKLATK